MTPIQLGQKVRDRITKVEGVVIARTEWLHGCCRITLQPTELKDGRPVDAVTIDEVQLEVVDARNMFASGQPEAKAHKQQIAEVAQAEERNPSDMARVLWREALEARKERVAEPAAASK